ncbi:ion transporter [Hahella sp. HN01]|uniref:ion transporter n=1 Tax=Hahella sp. HN01 TaxID=2847262 RepID=UPI001C1EE769|nr:ion transporter [Hahella sp. HN01]MBU6952622.1 ion transporter [Hahella sp. HN01]
MRNAVRATRARLEPIVLGDKTLTGRLFDYAVQALIIVSLICFSIETLPNNSTSTKEWLGIIEAFSVALFTFEYVLRAWVTQPTRKYIFSFFGIIDFLAIAPFYVTMGLDLRVIRAFRLLRLVRILKLARYSQAAKRFHYAFLIAKEELILFSSLTLILIYLAGVGIYYFENPVQPEAFQSIFHSLWWAVATLTTVGYGDIYPLTAGGKIFTFFVLIIGLGIVAIPAGIIASALGKAREMENRD